MAKKNTTDQSSNPLVRAVEEANLEGVFEELGIPKPPAPVPVIIFGGFCNWSVRGAVLGFFTWLSTH